MKEVGSLEDKKKNAYGQLFWKEESFKTKNQMGE
jgi:hypothetical protein